MGAMNRVFLMGNLTRNPEVRKTPAGLAVADLGLAVSEKYRNKAGEVVDLESLARKGIIRKVEMPVKILGDGEISVALTVKVPSVSEAARLKITAAGGTVETL